MQTNPVVVLRLLKCLEQAGLVTLRPGKDGGVSLARSPDEITLAQVHTAVDAGEDMFALRVGGNPRCAVNKSMPRLLKSVFASTGQAVAGVLGQTTIGSLARSIH